MNFVREQSLREIIENAPKIYFRHFLKVVGPFFIFNAPIAYYVDWEGSKGGNPVADPAWLVGLALAMFAGILSYPIILISLSDICLGNRSSLPRTLKRLGGATLGKILATNLLQLFFIALTFLFLIIPIIIGRLGGTLGKILVTNHMQVFLTALALMFLIVPCIIAVIWMMFATPVVVLEGKWGMQAIRRSRSLGKGAYKKIFFTCLVLLCMIFVSSTLFGFIAGFAMAVLPFGLDAVAEGNRLLKIISSNLALPLMLIAIVLLYYDLRAKKEAYDRTALAQELMR